MIKSGFTFVEILIVVSIIAILSVATFSSFFGFIERQDWEGKITVFKEKLLDFDSQIQKKEILNYTIDILTGSGYTFETDTKSSFYSLWDIDFSRGIFAFTWNIDTSSTIKIENINGGKYTLDQFVAWWIVYSGSFQIWKDQLYTIYVDGKQKNSVGISYYWVSDTSNDSKNIILSSVWSNSDKSWTSYSGVVLKNSFGKKSLETLSWVSLSTVSLFFEKGGHEYSLTLP